jgi:hypothetical protein
MSATGGTPTRAEFPISAPTSQGKGAQFPPVIDALAKMGNREAQSLKNIAELGIAPVNLTFSGQDSWGDTARTMAQGLGPGNTMVNIPLGFGKWAHATANINDLAQANMFATKLKNLASPQTRKKRRR